MKRVEKRLVLKKSVKRLCNQILYTIIVFLIGMILVKKNPDLKEVLRENIYEKSIKFQKMQSIYEKYFGNLLSVKNVKKKDTPVFTEKLAYQKVEEYDQGLVKVQVKDNTPISFLESGVIVYIGKKENLGNTVIIEQVDGTNVSYSNIDTTDIKIYDYVEKGEILGKALENTLYLSFQKDGKYLDYKEYL